VKPRNWKSILFNVLKVVVSAGLLAYVLIFRVDLRAMGEAISDARWGYLATAIVLAMAGVALRAVRWLVLLRALDIEVPLKRLVKLYYVGTFFNIFMPSGFGGDAIRIIELARHSKKTPEAIGTVLVDRATGLWVLFLLGLLALPFAAGSLTTRMIVLIGAVALAVVIGGWLVMGTRFVPWLGSRVRLPGQDKLDRFYRAVSGCGYRALGQACLISLIFNAMNIYTNYTIARAYDVRLSFGVFVTFAPVLATSLMLPSVGGLGVREEAYRLLYGTVEVPGTLAVAMSLTTFAVQTLLPGIVGAVLYTVEGAAQLRRSRDAVRPAGARSEGLRSVGAPLDGFRPRGASPPPHDTAVRSHDAAPQSEV
jgi:uncharacterized protein (TIRG00374 family)